MTQSQQAASAWRIELAREICPLYSKHPDIKMIVLGGSPSRIQSDAYSDLDIIVFWEKLDLPWIQDGPLNSYAIERASCRELTDHDVCVESYYLEGLKIDFGHTTLTSWTTEVASVLEAHQPEPSLLKSMSGFLSSIPLHGMETIQQWKERIRHYPDALAENVIRSHLRFFVKGYLLNQCLKRGETLAFQDGKIQTLKNLLNILAAANHTYFSAEEPRWIEYELEQMQHTPDNAWVRIQQILNDPAETSIEALETLILEVTDIAEQQLPHMDLSRARRWTELSVDPCPQKPTLRPKNDLPN